MHGVHDMGGYHWNASIDPAADEPVFHELWEGRVFALQVVGATHGYWTSDEYRWAIEKMPAARYLSTTYFEHWLTAMETIFVAKGLFSLEEHRTAVVSAEKTPFAAPIGSTPAELREAVDAVIANGGSTARDTSQTPLFAVGDRVRTKRDVVPGHTRLPAYARAAVGTVVISHGPHVLPEAASLGLGDENPQPVYAVRFQGRDLWGAGAELGTSTTVDLWECHLTAASSAS